MDKSSGVKFSKYGLAKGKAKTTKKFAGREDDLEGYVYEITSAKNTDRYL